MNFELGTSYKLAPARGVLNSARRIINFELGTSCKLAPAGVFEDVERIGRRIDESIVNPYIL